MRFGRLIFGAVLILLLCSFLSFGFDAIIIKKINKAPTEPKYVPGEVLVKLKAGFRSARAISTFAKEYGLELIENIPKIHVYRFKIKDVKIKFKDAKAAVERMVKLLSKDERVVYAEPNYIRSIMETHPNDPYYQDDPYVGKGQWFLWSTDPGIEGHIRAPLAWDITTGSPDVVVAVVDTGVDTDHPDLEANLLPGYDFVDEDPDPNPGLTEEGDWHGTHCAGLVAAVTNNAVGVASIGWNVKILPIRAGTGSGLYVSDICESVVWAADQGAKVISMSFGGYGFSQAEYDAMYYAYEKGCLLVAAAGNESNDNDEFPLYPAGFPFVMSVASCDGINSLSYFSNYGDETTDIAAPGGFYDPNQELLPGYPGFPYILSTYVREDGTPGYAWAAGTSMATPIVAGTAALIFSLRPDLTNDEVRTVIRTTGDPLQGTFDPDSHDYGIYRLNAFRAVESVALPVSWEPEHPEAGDEITVKYNLTAPTSKFATEEDQLYMGYFFGYRPTDISTTEVTWKPMTKDEVNLTFEATLATTATTDFVFVMFKNDEDVHDGPYTIPVSRTGISYEGNFCYDLDTGDGDFTPDAGEPLTIVVMLKNNDAFTHQSVKLLLEKPEEIYWMPDEVNVGTIPPEATVEVYIPAVIRSTVEIETSITIDATVEAEGGGYAWPITFTLLPVNGADVFNPWVVDVAVSKTHVEANSTDEVVVEAVVVDGCDLTVQGTLINEETWQELGNVMFVQDPDSPYAPFAYKATVEIENLPSTLEAPIVVRFTAKDIANNESGDEASFAVGRFHVDHDVLLVVDTPHGRNPAAFVKFYREGLAAQIGHTFDIWSFDYYGPLNPKLLNYYKLIVLGVPYFPNSFTDGGLTVEHLMKFLDRGGRLFIAGQDIGWMFADPYSPYANPETEEFLTEYLGAEYVQDNVGVYTAKGLDILADIGEFDLNPGLLPYPDEIEPVPNATPVTQYVETYEETAAKRINVEGLFREALGIGPAIDVGKAPVKTDTTMGIIANGYAGVRNEKVHEGGLPFRTVYISFGLEAIYDLGKAKDIVAKSVEWLMQAPAEAPSISVAPEEIDFGEVVFGETKQEILTITNTGEAPLSFIIKPVSYTIQRAERVVLGGLVDRGIKKGAKEPLEAEEGGTPPSPEGWVLLIEDANEEGDPISGYPDILKVYTKIENGILYFKFVGDGPWGQGIIDPSIDIEVGILADVDQNPSTGGDYPVSGMPIGGEYLIDWDPAYGGAYLYEYHAPYFYKVGQLDYWYADPDSDTVILGVALEAIRDPDALDVIAYGVHWSTYYYDLAPDDGYATVVVRPKWLLVEPEAGEVAPGQSVDVTVKVDTSQLTPGEWHGTIFIFSNDPIKGVVVVPAKVKLVYGAKFEYPAGWSMISVPLVPASPEPSAVFDVDPLILYRWATGGYVMYDEDNPAEFGEIAPGEGYWIKLLEPHTFTYKGEPTPLVDVAGTKAVKVTLKAGWNLIGVPFIGGFKWGDVLVKIGEEIVPITEQNIVLPWVFWYEAGGYKFGGFDTVLEPGRGYWVYATEDVEIYIPKPVGAKSVGEVSFDTLDKGEWLVQVSVEGDAYNFFGYRAEATNAPEPPAAPAGGFRLYFDGGYAFLETGKETPVVVKAIIEGEGVATVSLKKLGIDSAFIYDGKVLGETAKIGVHGKKEIYVVAGTVAVPGEVSFKGIRDGAVVRTRFVKLVPEVEATSVEIEANAKKLVCEPGKPVVVELKPGENVIRARGVVAIAEGFEITGPWTELHLTVDEALPVATVKVVGGRVDVTAYEPAVVRVVEWNIAGEVVGYTAREVAVGEAFSADTRGKGLRLIEVVAKGLWTGDVMRTVKAAIGR